MPTRIEDVAGWAQQLRDERVNDTGRSAVDALELLALLLVKAYDKGDGSEAARIAAQMARLFGVALTADRSESNRSIVALRQRVEAADAMADRLNMH